MMMPRPTYMLVEAGHLAMGTDFLETKLWLLCVLLAELPVFLLGK